MRRNDPRTLHIFLLLAAALVAVPAWSQECLPAPDGLVSWWSGDAGASDIEDGNDGTFTDGATIGTGLVGNAFDLDGYDDMVSVADSPGVRPAAITLAAWINLDSFNGTLYGGAAGLNPLQYIIFKKNSRATTFFNGYALSQRGQRIIFSARAADGSVTFFHRSSGLNTGQWYHVAATYDGDTARLYVDGVLQSDAADVPAAGGVALDHAATPLTFGRTGQDGETGEADFDAVFDGRLDEVMLFDRALSASEVAAMYDAAAAGVCKDEDGDGFRPPFDCDETSASVNPDAVELPGNFTDENCDGNLGDCDPCATWRNHGEYVRCVAHGVNDLVVEGALSEEAGDELVSSAARSSIGKRGFVPAECEAP